VIGSNKTIYVIIVWGFNYFEKRQTKYNDFANTSMNRFIKISGRRFFLKRLKYTTKLIPTRKVANKII